MRFFPRKYHAVIDYFYGFLLMISPWLLNFRQYEAATNVAYIWGLAVILVSLNTDYEGGASRAISMATHLHIDVAGGLLFALSPWVLSFDEQMFTFHLLAGAFSILAGLITVSRSQNPKMEHVDDMSRSS